MSVTTLPPGRRRRAASKGHPEVCMGAGRKMRFFSTWTCDTTLHEMAGSTERQKEHRPCSLDVEGGRLRMELARYMEGLENTATN